jgi:hypothetical protein
MDEPALADMSNENIDLRWLALGAFAGLVMAAWGMLRQADSAAELPPSAIASVNGTLISRELFERTRERLGPQAQDDATAAQLLGQLVDDELLVQRGVELGMTETDSAVRTAIINSLVASVTAEADAANPSDEELGAYLEAHGERFSHTSRLHVEAWETDREELAQTFVSALRAGESLPESDDIRAMPDLPAGLLATDMLSNYLGPAITAAAAEMPDGSSAVFARRGRWLVLRVVAKERQAVDDLDSVRSRVAMDYRRQLAADLLESYLDNLRQRADIRTRQP